jgi:hypothetical protein
VLLVALTKAIKTMKFLFLYPPKYDDEIEQRDEFDPNYDNRDDLDGVDWESRFGPNLVRLSAVESKYDDQGYPENWESLSYMHRSNADWKCEACGVDLSSHKDLLHVHHINGKSYDNRQTNLMALCLLCHAEQHEHMKRECTRDMDIVRQLRKQQSVR